MKLALPGTETRREALRTFARTAFAPTLRRRSVLRRATRGCLPIALSSCTGTGAARACRACAPECFHKFFSSLLSAWGAQSQSKWPSVRAERGRVSPVWCWRIRLLRLLRWQQRSVHPGWGGCGESPHGVGSRRCSRPSGGFRVGSSASLCAILGLRSELSSRARGRAAPASKARRCSSWRPTPIRWYRPHRCAVSAWRPRALGPFAPGVSSHPPRWGRRHARETRASDTAPTPPFCSTIRCSCAHNSARAMRSRRGWSQPAF